MTEQTTRPVENAAAGRQASAGGLARVWIFQPTIQHYRLPIFDELLERGRREGLYELTVLGGMNNGGAHGGGKRPYFRDVPEETYKRGVTFCWWPGSTGMVESERPDLVVLTGNPRSSSAWRLPRVCASLGIPCIGWSKVHSYSALRR
ncbi:MAG: hypothetical protein QM783_00720 [Phycisphaerales bacterium]